MKKAKKEANPIAANLFLSETELAPLEYYQEDKIKLKPEYQKLSPFKLDGTAIIIDRPYVMVKVPKYGNNLCRYWATQWEKA